jgi:cysteine synthase
MENLIGNTPLLHIVYEFKGERREIFAKAEYYNLTGSIKDRMASHIIKESLKDGTLKEKMPIVEATSGNTGIAFSALGALKDHEIHIFMPDWMSNERKWMITKYGATLHEVSKEQGGFIGSIKKADEFLCYGYDLKQFNYQFTDFIASNRTINDDEKGKINFLILDCELNLHESSSQNIQLYNLLTGIRSLFKMNY